VGGICRRLSEDDAVYSFKWAGTATGLEAAGRDVIGEPRPLCE
jgi:hypothetical protein